MLKFNMLNKHGLKMKKIRAAAKETNKTANGKLRTQITYRKTAGLRLSRRPER